jgi:hypothetical protein
MLKLFTRYVMPLSKPVLLSLSNNGIGIMANWLRHLSKCPLTLPVGRRFHQQSTRLHLTAQSFVSRPSDGPFATGIQRQPLNPTHTRQGPRPQDAGGKDIDVERIYGRLRIEASHGSNADGVNANSIADHLVRVLGQKPDLRLYSSLILANCRPGGSVAEVKALIRDLRAQGLDLDSSTCHDVLKVFKLFDVTRRNAKVNIRFFPYTLTTSSKPRSSTICRRNGSV